MFNLGYLPGGDKAIVTRPGHDCDRVGFGTGTWLVPGGMITVLVYPGHEEGQAEADAVVSWARQVPPDRAVVGCYQLLNTRNAAPMLLALARTSRSVVGS